MPVTKPFSKPIPARAHQSQLLLNVRCRNHKSDLTRHAFEEISWETLLCPPWSEIHRQPGRKLSDWVNHLRVLTLISYTFCFTSCLQPRAPRATDFPWPPPAGKMDSSGWYLRVSAYIRPCCVFFKLPFRLTPLVAGTAGRYVCVWQCWLIADDGRLKWCMVSVNGTASPLPSCR